MTPDQQKLLARAILWGLLGLFLLWVGLRNVGIGRVVFLAFAIFDLGYGAFLARRAFFFKK